MTRESDLERIIDARVMARLATDRAYRYAENAEEQAEREAEIERQEVERLQPDRYPLDDMTTLETVQEWPETDAYSPTMEGSK